MIYRFRKWLRDRRIANIKKEIAGHEARLNELKRIGYGNGFVAERIGRLKCELSILESA